MMKQSFWKRKNKKGKSLREEQANATFAFTFFTI